MAKNKKKSIGIKTTRYFTKTCTKCNFEYPNWFTNCPKCGLAWDETETEQLEESGEPKKKTIKIVVKITEEDFDNKLDSVKLIFSANNGISWYQIKMENKKDYFVAEINEVPIGSLIVYYIEVRLVSDDIIIENNDGKYYIYKVGASLAKVDKKPMKPEIKTKETQLNQIQQIDKTYNVYAEKKSLPDANFTKKMFEETTIISQESYKRRDDITNLNLINDKPQQNINISKVQLSKKPIEYKAEDSFTIFGKPQTQIDPDLKICPYCNSKIKKMWSTCPICGKQI